MFSIIRVKACKKCGGDLSLESDQYGTYVGCIQCGAIYGESDQVNYSVKKAAERQLVETAKASSQGK